MNEQELQQFLVKLASGAYTNEEYKVFVNWVENCSREEYELMLIYWEQVTEVNEDYDIIDQNLIAKIERGLDRIDEKENTPVIPLYHESTKRRKLWPRIAAAASILLILSAGSYFLLHKKQPAQQFAQTRPINIKPGSKKAILQLASGQQIALNEAPAGTLAKQGNATVTKTADGQVAYNGQSSTSTTEDIYNTITTQRGGYYPLKMADGTIAILDAASSIKYPVTFNGKERRVEITGQVYFIVAHNADKPFKVMVKDQVIQDIGTEFNINSYGDEPYIRTTLVQGSVKVTKQQQSVVLIPGQQAINDNQTIKVQKVNVEDVIAWKNGQTLFNGEDIHEIMRNVSRWYDVDIRYEGEIPTRQFAGSISRNANLSDLLNILEFDNVHFRVEGKTIIVKP
jgi:ferric-dicitrate binding protein FerR (iron transport regulator)